MRGSNRRAPRYAPARRKKNRRCTRGPVRRVTPKTWRTAAPIPLCRMHRLVVSTCVRTSHAVIGITSHPSGDLPVMRTSHSAARLLGLSFALVTILAGCETKRDRARADSLQAITDRQLALTTSLSSQKDSLMRAIFESDSLLTKIDSQIRSVKGLSAKKRVSRSYESPLEEQLMRRKELSGRVDALVQRARVTATELAESRRREQELRGKNDTLQL